MGAAGGGGLRLDGETRPQLIASDHKLHAFLSALVAYAALRGRTHPVPQELASEAAEEGWIHIPSVLLSDPCALPADECADANLRSS